MTDRRLLVETIAEKTMHLKNLNMLKKEIAAYLLTENQTASLYSILRDVMLYRAQHGLLEATIVSAYPISATVRRDVKNELKSEFPDAKEIVINERIDPQVVGGLRIETVNQQLDLSVKSKLNTLKRLTAARNY